MPQIFTIGVYGTTEDRFFAALQAAQIDTFCDIRRRRGMRGSLYAFANSQRLQHRLAELGINYVHLKELAPSEALRSQQQAADKKQKVAKRERKAVGDNFAQGYMAQLSALNQQQVLHDMGPNAHNIALFCVEREPEACHRSLVAAWLQQELGSETINLMP